MPQRRGLKGPPIGYLDEGEEWPDGRLIWDAPEAARFVQKLVRRLNKECGGAGQPTVYAIAKKANINAQTITNLLNGQTWGDVTVIYKLEATLERDLWSNDHLPKPWNRRKDKDPLR